MADVSKIKLPNGTTYNIKDTTSGYTTNTGTITKIQTTAGAHTTINVSSGAAAFNVPTKTSHLTNDSGFLTNSTLYEGRLNWGNINLAGNVTPVGMSLSAEHSANRIAYLNPAAITIEYTTDGGSNWLDSGYTDDEKTWLCTGSTGIAVGQSKSEYSSSTALTTNHWTRITLTGQNGSAGYVYTSPRKLLINVGSALGLSCLIEYKTGVSGANWQTFGTYTVSGWSGWNDIPLILGTFGGGSNQTGNTWYLRFTFKITSTRTDAYKGYSQILGLRLFGATDWGSASSNNSKGPFSSTGHLYSYDVNANATFPAKVTATSFSGPLTGNVTGNVSGTAANVTGTVAIAHGGTGQTTAANAINALLNGLPVWTADPTDTTYFVRQDTGGSATYGKVQATTLWNYISGKLPAWSKASTKPSYNFSEIGSTPTTLAGYGITDAKIASGTITLGSNTITPLTSSSTLNAAKLSGAIPSAVTATTQASTDNSTKIATTAYVTTAIANLPEPMVFKGSVGTGGTVTSLPTAAASNEGWTYKVITALSSPAAKVGDTVISNGSSWVVIPSGDEPSGTVTSVGVSNTTNGGLTVSGSPVTSAGTITIGHSNVLSSAQTTQAVYPIKIDKNGHISAYGNAVTIPTIPSNNVTGSGTVDYLARWSGTNTLSTTSLHISTSYNSSSDLYGTIQLHMGNTGQIDWKGQLVFYSGGSNTITITPSSLTADRVITLPNKTGVIALTSDIPTVPSNIVNTITTVAGAHTTISSQKGNVSFNVPTKTSHLTNDSGFITTDTNTTYALSGALSSHKFTSTLTAGGSGSGTSTSDFTLAAGTGITITDDTSNRKMTIACSVTNTDTKVSTNLAIDSQIYYPVLGTDTTNASTKNYDKGFMYLTESGTTSDIGEASLTLGNSTASGTTGNKKGTLTLYGSSAYGVILESGAPTAIRTITLPDNSGTIILDTDVLDTSNRDDLFEGRLITGAQYSYIPRFKSYTAYYDARINPPATSVTATLPYQGFGKIQIIDIISWDVTTGEKVIVDWSPSTHEIASGNMTINISISSSYSHAINCLILYRQVYGM